MSMAIRPALESDIPAIFRMIEGLAEYEKALGEVTATEQDLKETLFAQNPQIFCHVATVDSEVVGIAIWHLNYSTWIGKHGIYIEDLFVIPEERGKRHGLALLKELAQICIARGYERLQWSVLDWNEPSIRFYKSLGAFPLDEWTTFRISGDALKNLPQ
ncbi:MAG: GNAT family N-acetyltransferase [Actinomycetota bacterium]